MSRENRIRLSGMPWPLSITMCLGLAGRLAFARSYGGAALVIGGLPLWQGRPDRALRHQPQRGAPNPGRSRLFSRHLRHTNGRSESEAGRVYEFVNHGLKTVEKSILSGPDLRRIFLAFPPSFPAFWAFFRSLNVLMWKNNFRKIFWNFRAFRDNRSARNLVISVNT
jgi:hypothetical protein